MDGEPGEMIEAHEPFESGKYRALARLDQGGMAEVFLSLARGPAGFNKLVVVKRLRDALAEDVAHRELFLDEARLAARLNHANIVQTLEVAEQDGMFLIVMEYLEGQPLSRLAHELLKRKTPVHPAVFARILSQILSGLQYAHDLSDYDGTPLKIVHRDVSPQNVFLTYDGQVKLVDFGIAKAESSQTKTQAGTFKGKAAYMAPEQLIGDTIDRRADVFTSGIVLWEMLTRQRLMSAGSAAKTMMRIVNEDAPRVSSVVPDVDAVLDAIVARALARDPLLRFQTAQEMRDALEQYIEASGHIVRQQDVGALLTELFGDVRARVQREIKKQMATIGPGPISGIMIAAPPLLAGSEPSAMGSDPSASRLQPSTLVPALARSVFEPLPRPKGRIAAAAVVITATLAVLGGVAFGLSQRAPQSADPTKLASSAGTVQSAMVTTAPQEAAHFAPDSVAPVVETPPPKPQPVVVTRAPDPKPAPRPAPAHPTTVPATATPSATTPVVDIPERPASPPPAATPTQEGRKYRKEL